MTINAQFKIGLKDSTTYIMITAKDYNDLHKQLGKLQTQMIDKISDLLDPDDYPIKCSVDSIPWGWQEL